MRLNHLTYLASVFFCAAILLPSSAEEGDLYTPDPVDGNAQTLVDDGFFAFSGDLFNLNGFFSSIPTGTSFDSFPTNDLRAGFSTLGGITGSPFHPDAPVLDSEAGYSLTFELAVDAEEHIVRDDNGDGLDDRGGFVVLVVSENLMAIEIAFWENEIWAYEGGEEPLLFTHAEGAAQPIEAMQQLRSYQITVKADRYMMEVDGALLFEGPLRDYTAWPGLQIPILGNFDPYEKPSMIFLGDDTNSARSTVRLGNISFQSDVETPAVPPAPSNFRIKREPEATAVSWTADPDATFLLQISTDLIEWDKVATVTTASSGSGSFLLPKINVPYAYFRLVSVAP